MIALRVAWALALLSLSQCNDAPPNAGAQPPAGAVADIADYADYADIADIADSMQSVPASIAVL